MNYLVQLNRAINHIEENLNGELIVEEIAKEAGISKCHFQRVFKAVLGETVKEYTARRRLTLAAQELARANLSILEVALTFGFESHEVFSRAFKQFFQMSPSEFRQKSATAFVHVKPRITKAYIEHLYKGITMEARIVKLDESLVRGVSTRVNEVNSPEFPKNFSIISALWKTLREQARDFSYQKLSLIDSDLNYFAGVLVPDEEVLTQLELKQLPAGEYAEFLHIGPMSNIAHTMNYIYGSWFLNSGRDRGEGPDISLHTEKTDPSSNENEVRILIPLK